MNYTIPNFMGGINKGVDSSLIKANEAADAQNCNIDRGVLSNTKGFSSYGLAVLPAAPKSLMVYIQGTNKTLIAAAGGSIYKWSGSAWTSIGSGFQSDYWDYINDNYNNTDVIVMVNGVDNDKIYDGTTLRDLKGDPAVPATLAPKGKYIVLHYERAWIADDTTLYASTVNSSGFNLEDYTTPTSVTQANQHGVVISMYNQTGSKVKGMTVIFDDIIIFMEKGIIKIFGSNPENYTKVGFSPKGGIADRSIANFERGSFFIDKSGIYLYDGTNVTLISQALGDLFDTLNNSVLDKAVGIVYKSKYILAVPEGSSTNNNLIIEYDYLNKNFMLKRGYSVAAFTEYQDSLLFVSTDNNIYQYGITDTFNGTAVNAYWETGYSDLGVPESTKEYEAMYFTAYGSGQIKITVTTEKGFKTVTKTLSNTETPYYVNFNHRGRLVKARIENISGAAFTIKGFKLIYDNELD